MINSSFDFQGTTACIQQINNIGNTVYTNICTGSIKTVPWGSLDWTLAIGATLSVIAVVLLYINILSE